MEENLKMGDVVCSKNGRFKGVYFVVTRMEDGYAYVANGKHRKSDNPKKKKLKHLQADIGHSEHIAHKLEAGEKVTNAEMRITLQKYEQ
ncbi:MAG: KOW domain-containing RNA-binding protein [Clostridiales bacterium]|jgi:ribosomal protein L14E/L6E/L27E|nr:KOW domain-containing RNA-binding protein [Clostridiales bacterium]